AFHHTSSRSQLGNKLLVRQHALNQHFHLATARLLPEHACRNHSGVVEDKQVLGLQQRQQIAELAMLNLTVLAPQVQQAAVAAARARVVGDLFWRQVEMEIAECEGGHEGLVSV